MYLIDLVQLTNTQPLGMFHASTPNSGRKILKVCEAQY